MHHPDVLTRAADATRATLDTFHAISNTALPLASSADLIAHFT